MDQHQIDALAQKLGKEASDELQKGWVAYEAKTREIIAEAQKQGGITKERFDEYQAATKEAQEATQEILRKQGVTLQELQQKLESGNSSIKSIAEVLHESESMLKAQYLNGSGATTFMVNQKADGTFTMRPFKTTEKAAGVTGTIDGLSGGGSLSSIAQSLNASTLLRMGGNSQIYGNYRNTQWLFELVNVINAGWDMPFAMWFEETAVQGAPAIVPEGGTKPLVQYAYTLKTTPYKKAAQLVTFTEEFSLDFPRLQSDIMGKGRTDVMNFINAALLTDLTTAAQAYNSAAAFTGGVGIPFVNDFDVLAAMAAQVDNNTFGSLANTAIMSTFKKYRMGITKSTQGEYLNRPDVLDNLAFIGNPAMGPDDVVVGDLKQMNLILRGGFLVKIGYNGTDFAENKFSVVMEQYFYDYIPTVRQAAIVKGPTFSDVKTAIGA